MASAGFAESERNNRRLLSSFETPVRMSFFVTFCTLATVAGNVIVLFSNPLAERVAKVFVSVISTSPLI